MRISDFKIAILVAGLFIVSGCRKEDMGSQPKAKPMQESAFFANHTSARTLVDGTVAQGHLNADTDFYTGMHPGPDGKLVPINHFPNHYTTENRPVTDKDSPFPTQGPELRRVLENGQEKFTIFCAMCHGDTGEGNGIIVQRGFVPPPSYHIDRLRTTPVGHIFDQISVGSGAMYSYGDRISPADRWAIVAYVRTLQISQSVKKTDFTPEQIKQLEAQQVKAQ